MKHHGSTSDFIPERNREIYTNVMSIMMHEPEIGIREACAEAAKMPTKQFWVSETRAAQVLGELRKGGVTGRFTGKKQKMYVYLLKRVEAILEMNPDLPLIKAVREIIEEEAPELYLKTETVYQIFLKERERIMQERRMQGTPVNTMNMCHSNAVKRQKRPNASTRYPRK